MNSRTLARPVSSSVTACRSTVSCRLAFSIETTAWPARYSSRSSSSRVNAAPWRAIEIAPRYSGPSTSDRRPIDSACTPGPCTDTARRVRSARSSPSSAPSSSEPTSGLTTKTSRSAASIAFFRSPATSPTSQPEKAPWVERQRAAHLGVAGVDRLPHRERDHAVAVDARGERVADAPDRLGQLLALALGLLHLRLELRPTCR